MASLHWGRRESSQGEEGTSLLSPSAPALCQHLPLPRASALQHLGWWLGNLTVHFARVLCLIHLVTRSSATLSDFFPAGGSQPQGQHSRLSVERRSQPSEWTPLSLKGAFLGGSSGAAGLFPKASWLPLHPSPEGSDCSSAVPWAFPVLFTYFQPISTCPGAPTLFCSSSSAALAT